jgi:hypothetical protein
MSSQIPAACREYQDAADRAAAKEQQVLQELLQTTGDAAWKAHAVLGTARAERAAAEAVRDQCLKENAAVLSGRLQPIDASSAAVSRDTAPQRTAQLWDLTGGGSEVKDTSVVANDAFAFTATKTLPNLFGVTVTTVGVTGPDFRSVRMTRDDLVDGSRMRAEFVLFPVIHLTRDDVNRTIEQLPRDPIVISNLGATATVKLTGSRGDLVDNGLTAHVTGYADITGPFGATANVLFEFKASVRLLPSDPPATVDLAEAETDLFFNAAVEVDLKMDAAGPLSGIIPALLPLVRTELHEHFRKHVQVRLHREIKEAMEAALAIKLPPPGVSKCSISVRRFAITPDAITFQPAFGALGTALSEYRPAGLSS